MPTIERASVWVKEINMPVHPAAFRSRRFLSCNLRFYLPSPQTLKRLMLDIRHLISDHCADPFFRKGIEGRIFFRYDARGKVDALIDRRNNEDVVWRKTE
jgi:hypothetical protein